jgi:hypothetical protein
VQARAATHKMLWSRKLHSILRRASNPPTVWTYSARDATRN